MKKGLPICPACKTKKLDPRTYDSLLALHKDLGVFTFTCPLCSTRVSLVMEIPDNIREEVYFASVQIGSQNSME